MKKSTVKKNLKELQSEQTKQLLIEVSTKLFARKGFYGTSIADIAQAAGLTKGALYHHFKDKDDIFFAVINSVRSNWQEEVAQEVISGKNSFDKISILFEKHADLLSRNDFMCLVMSNLMNEMGDDDPKYSAVLNDTYKEFVLFVEEIIYSGQSKGEIRSDLDSRLLSLNIVGILKGIGCYPKLNFVEIDRKAMANSLKTILVDGLKT
jgi:AcrR family transcriptional regulator